jgi:hypothetical protein
MWVGMHCIALVKTFVVAEQLLAMCRILVGTQHGA